MATEEETPPLRDFAAVLLDLPGAHAEATEKLIKVINAVRQTQKGGSLTLKFKINTGKLDDTQIEIQPEVVTSIPRLALKGGVFFPDEHGNPTKDDPSQLWRGDDIRSAPTFVDMQSGEIKEAPTV